MQRGEINVCASHPPIHTQKCSTVIITHIVCTTRMVYILPLQMFDKLFVQKVPKIACLVVLGQIFRLARQWSPQMPRWECLTPPISPGSVAPGSVGVGGGGLEIMQKKSIRTQRWKERGVPSKPPWVGPDPPQEAVGWGSGSPLVQGYPPTPKPCPTPLY